MSLLSTTRGKKSTKSRRDRSVKGVLEFFLICQGRRGGGSGLIPEGGGSFRFSFIVLRGSRSSIKNFRGRRGNHLRRKYRLGRSSRLGDLPFQTIRKEDRSQALEESARLIGKLRERWRDQLDWKFVPRRFLPGKVGKQGIRTFLPGRWEGGGGMKFSIDSFFLSFFQRKI